MADPRRRFLFALADRLHMTVARLEAELTVAEFTEWQAYFKDLARRSRKGRLNRGTR